MGFGWSLDLYTIIYLVYSMTELPIEEQFKMVRDLAIDLFAQKIYPFTVPAWINLPDEEYDYKPLLSTEYERRGGKLYYKSVARDALSGLFTEIEWE